MKRVILFLCCAVLLTAIGAVPVPRRAPWFKSGAAAGFDPRQIQGLAFRWVATDLTDGIITGNWTDQIQGTTNFAQGAVRQQSWKAYQGVWFSGYGGGMSNYSIALPNTYSIYYVIRPFHDTTRKMFIIGDSAGSSGMYIDTSGRLNFGAFAGGTTSSSALADDNNYAIIQTAANGAGTGAIYTNGVLSVNGSYTTQPLSGIGGDSGAHGAQTWIYEICVWTNKVITAGDIANLQTYSTTTYTNPPVSPPWAPANVKGLVMWVSPTNSVLVKNGANAPPADGDAVWFAHDTASREFMAANGVDTSQAAGPIFKTSGGANNQAFFGFTNTALYCQSITYTWNQTNWVFAVIDTDTAAVTGTIFDGGVAGGSREQGVIQAATKFFLFAGAVLQDVVAWPFNGHQVLITFIVNGNNSEIRTNLVPAITGAAGAQALNQPIIMKDTTTSNPLKARVYDFLVYNAAAGFSGSSQDVWKVSNYLTNKVPYQ